MNKSRFSEKAWIKYVVAAVVGLIATVLIVWARGFWDAEVIDYTTENYHAVSSLDRVRILSDAFFIVGALMTSFGAILFVSSHGAFDGLFFAIKSLTWFFRFREDTLKKGKPMSFYEYREEKAAKPKMPFLFLVIVGIAFILVAGIFTIIFLNNFVD